MSLFGPPWTYRAGYAERTVDDCNMHLSVLPSATIDIIVRSLLYGCPSRPHYGSCPSVGLSVCHVRGFNSKTKRRRKKHN